MDDAAGVPEVRPPTIDDIRRICRALDDAGARYVLIRPSDAADRAWLETLRRADSE